MQQPIAKNLRYIHDKNDGVYQLMHRYDPPVRKHGSTNYGPNIGFVNAKEAQTLRNHTDSDDEFKVALYEFIMQRYTQVDLSADELEFECDRDKGLCELQGRPERKMGGSPDLGEWRTRFTACFDIKHAIRIAKASDRLDAFKLALHEFAKEHFKRRFESRGIDIE